MKDGRVQLIGLSIFFSGIQTIRDGLRCQSLNRKSYVWDLPRQMFGQELLSHLTVYQLSGRNQEQMLKRSHFQDCYS